MFRYFTDADYADVGFSVAENHACPNCGERRTTELKLLDSEQIECTCGVVYSIDCKNVAFIVIHPAMPVIGSRALYLKALGYTI